MRIRGGRWPCSWPKAEANANGALALFPQSLVAAGRAGRGGAALAAPAAQARRRTCSGFSTLRFLDDSPQPRGSPLRLRDLLLFALRVLALLLVVAAFAWPYLRGQEPVVVEESRVYILDNTLSHQAEDGFIRGREIASQNEIEPGPVPRSRSRSSN